MLTSFEIARKCDAVFAEDIDKNQMNYLEGGKYSIVSTQNNKITYINKSLELFEGAYVFCHTSFLEDLFYTLNKTPNLPKINLITHQSDIEINKNIFIKKPTCIDKWFGVNINYNNDKLFSIPLGLGNNFSNKNILKKDLEIFKEINLDKEIKLYLNFNMNTNKKERANLYKSFQSKSWAVVDKYLNNKNSYLENLNKYFFILCPWGKGFDTHRIWEALQLGSVPVVKNHNTFDYLKDMPVLFIDEYEEIDESLLKNFHNSMDNISYNLDKNNSSYWFNYIFSGFQNRNNNLTLEVNTKLIKFKKQLRYSSKKLLNYPIKLKAKLFLRIKKYLSK